MTLNEKLREMLPSLGMPVASLKLPNDVDGNIEYQDVYTADQILDALQNLELKEKVSEGAWIERKQHDPHPQDGTVEWINTRGESGKCGAWELNWDCGDHVTKYRFVKSK